MVCLKFLFNRKLPGFRVWVRKVYLGYGEGADLLHAANRAAVVAVGKQGGELLHSALLAWGAGGNPSFFSLFLSPGIERSISWLPAAPCSFG